MFILLLKPSLSCFPYAAIVRRWTEEKSMESFSFLLPLIIIIGIIALVVHSRKTKKADWICTSCSTITEPESFTKGSILIEIILWLAFIIPGVIYSIWRLTTKQQVCPACKKPSLIPLDTPAGQKQVRDSSI